MSESKTTPTVGAGTTVLFRRLDRYYSSPLELPLSQRGTKATKTTTRRLCVVILEKHALTSGYVSALLSERASSRDLLRYVVFWRCEGSRVTLRSRAEFCCSHNPTERFWCPPAFISTKSLSESTLFFKPAVRRQKNAHLVHISMWYLENCLT